MPKRRVDLIHYFDQEDYLAQTLGVHRSTVIRVARPLQEKRIIEYARGRIAILDRAKLERAACECNGAIARHSKWSSWVPMRS